MHIETHKTMNTNEKIQYLVYGYVHKFSTNIPIAIMDLCIDFYCVKEKFTVHGSLITLNDEMDTVNIANGLHQNKSDVEGTAFGNIYIDKDDKIYVWEFEITNNDSNNLCINVGIASSNALNISLDKYLGSDVEYKYYSYGCGGYIYSHKGGVPDGYGISMRSGNIAMILDTSKTSIRWCSATTYDSVAFDDIEFDKDTKYYMAVTLSGSKKTVKLLNFIVFDNELHFKQYLEL
eukprot:180493_1